MVVAMPPRLVLIVGAIAVVVAMSVFRVRVFMASAKLFLALLLIVGAVTVLLLLRQKK